MKRRIGRVGLAAAALLALSGPLRAACALPPDAGSVIVGDGVRLAWKARPAAILVGQPFALDLQTCPADARVLRVDATMPEHRHGMNYKPSIQPAGAGRWRVEGLLWHMGGRWELRVDVESKGQVQSLRQSLTLP